MDWYYESEFLTKDFHSTEGFNSVIDHFVSGWLYEIRGGGLTTKDYVGRVCLGLGMAIREINRVNDLEDDDTNPAIPGYVKSSAAPWSCREKLIDICVKLAGFLMNESASSNEDETSGGEGEDGRSADDDGSYLGRYDLTLMCYL